MSRGRQKLATTRSGVYLLHVGVVRYIGASINLTRRRHEHFGDLRRQVHANPFLQHQFNMGGEVQFQPLLFCAQEHLHFYEKLCIENLDTVNVQQLSEASFNQPQRVRDSISRTSTGRVKSDITRQKLREAALRQHAEGRGGMLGKKQSPEASIKRVATRRKNNRYIVSEETKQKIRDGLAVTRARKAI